MSEAVSRPAMTRGRGSARGGRGGGRGGTRGRDRQINGSYKEPSPPVDDFADEGELGDMKKQYSSQLPMLKELFSDWTEVDLLFALQETDGDLDSTIERISEGHVSKFSDVKSSKEKSKPKAKEQSSFGDAAATSRPGRGRGGSDSVRGRGPRPDRGQRGTRGRGVTHSTNGTRPTAASTNTPAAGEPAAWDQAAAPDATASNSWDTPAQTDGVAKPATKAAPETSKPAPVNDDGPKKTWAQMFAKPPAAPQKIPEPAPAPEAGVTPSETSSGFVEVTHADAEPEDIPTPPTADDIPIHEPPEISDPLEPPITLTPSKDQLTVENVEHLPDTAHPAPVGTAASTVESSRGPDSMTPSVAGQSAQVPIGRPMLGGYATTAYKATATPGRTPSFQRRLMEQQEAVVMPGNHLVDRTAVQFGSMGLNGDALDVDEDREEAETRTQPPGHSPVAQPRASLPPIPRQHSATTDGQLQENTTAAQKPAPGLPPAPQQHQPFAQQSPNQLASQASQQGGQAYNQFGRYGQPNLPSESSAQKAYDAFGQQHPQQSAYDAYPSQSQAPSQQPQAPSHLSGFSSAATDYSQYYTADQRSAYQNYYNNYSQQPSTSQQDAGASQQRTGSAFGASGESAFPSSQSQQAPSRYDAQPSGHTTPNPALAGQQQSGSQSQTQQAQHLHQQPHGQSQHAGYPYQHPYYNSPYYSAYMNQYATPYGQQNYQQTPFGGKGGMYNQSHGYPQNSYDQHSSSPANPGGFSQSSMHGRDSNLASGLGGDYARSGSAQPSQSQQQSGAGAFGGINDPFGRAPGAYAGQSQQYGQQQGGQQGGNEDALKPFGDPKAGSGPSPSAVGQPGRPGSATNTAGQTTGSGLPPPQSHQQGFGSYPGGHLAQMGQTSQYGGGLGGLGGGHTAGAQSHQAGGYGGYGPGTGANAAGGFGGNSYSPYSGHSGRGGGGGGWGGNYGH